MPFDPGRPKAQKTSQHLAARPVASDGRRDEALASDQPPLPRQVPINIGQHASTPLRPGWAGRRSTPARAGVPSLTPRTSAVLTSGSHRNSPSRNTPNRARQGCRARSAQPTPSRFAELRHPSSHKRPVGLERRQRTENERVLPAPSRRRRTSPLSEQRNAPVRVAATRTVRRDPEGSGLAEPPRLPSP